MHSRCPRQPGRVCTGRRSVPRTVMSEHPTPPLFLPASARHGRAKSVGHGARPAPHRRASSQRVGGANRVDPGIRRFGRVARGREGVTSMPASGTRPRSSVVAGSSQPRRCQAVPGAVKPARCQTACKTDRTGTSAPAKPQRSMWLIRQAKRAPSAARSSGTKPSAMKISAARPAVNRAGRHSFRPTRPGPVRFRLRTQPRLPASSGQRRFGPGTGAKAASSTS